MLGTRSTPIHLLVELFLGFVLLPAFCVVWYRVFLLPLPVVPLLFVLGLVFWRGMRKNLPRTLARALRRRGLARELPRILTLWMLSAGAIYQTLLQRAPEQLFRFPREEPWLWVAVMLVYPLFSVVPQELVYRVFFWRRYRPLLRSDAALLAVNAVLFGGIHLVFGSAISVVLSMLGGVFFAWTWIRTRSLWLCALEHALYGCLVFTLGLGPHFYAKLSGPTG